MMDQACIFPILTQLYPNAKIIACLTHKYRILLKTFKYNTTHYKIKQITKSTIKYHQYNSSNFKTFSLLTFTATSHSKVGFTYAKTHTIYTMTTYSTGRFLKVVYSLIQANSFNFISKKIKIIQLCSKQKYILIILSPSIKEEFIVSTICLLIQEE